MTLQDRLQSVSPYVLSILRIVTALLFMEHGLSKLFAFPVAHGAPAAFSLIWFAGVIETAGGALVTLGLFTRLSAFIMSGEMAFAYFMAHAPHGFYPLLNHGEGAILYCFIFFYFVFAGAGPLSLDAAFKGKARAGGGQMQGAGTGRA